MTCRSAKFSTTKLAATHSKCDDRLAVTFPATECNAAQCLVPYGRGTNIFRGSKSRDLASPYTRKSSSKNHTSTWNAIGHRVTLSFAETEISNFSLTQKSDT